MRSDQPMAEALRDELLPLAKTLKKKLRKAKRANPKAVHDARTLLRRLREGLAVMRRTVCEREPAAALADALRDFERLLGPARDDGVLLADIDEWRSHPTRPAPAPGLVEWLTDERARHAQSLASGLRLSKTKRVLRRLKRWLEDPPPIKPKAALRSARAVPSLVRHFLPEETWHAYDRILAFDRHPVTGLDVIHKVRSTCRRLRYLLELFQGALSPDAMPLIASLQTLQDRLGALHDHGIAVDRIEAALHSAKIPDSPALQLYLAHRRRARDLLAAEFQDEWLRLTGDTFRFALSHLISGERIAGRLALVLDA